MDIEQEEHKKRKTSNNKMNNETEGCKTRNHTNKNEMKKRRGRTGKRTHKSNYNE